MRLFVDREVADRGCKVLTQCEEAVILVTVHTTDGWGQSRGHACIQDLAKACTLAAEGQGLCRACAHAWYASTQSGVSNVQSCTSKLMLSNCVATCHHTIVAPKDALI